MAALSDTPTPPPPQTMLAVPQASINLKQGVLHEETECDDNASGGVKGLRNQHEDIIKDNLSNPLQPKDMTNDDLSLEVKIKNEPAIDINDYYEPTDSFNEDNDPTPAAPVTPVRRTCNRPIVRKTYDKLMPTPNAVNPKRRYECPFDNCTKSYGKSSHLRSHLTWHTGLKPFVCNEPGCGKGFTRSDELNRHVRTHTGEKPFECVHCTKKFSRSDHLTKHLVTHSKQNGGMAWLMPPTKRAKLSSVLPGNTVELPSSHEGKPVEKCNESIPFVFKPIMLPKEEPKDTPEEVEGEEDNMKKSESPKNTTVESETIEISEENDDHVNKELFKDNVAQNNYQEQHTKIPHMVELHNYPQQQLESPRMERQNYPQQQQLELPRMERQNYPQQQLEPPNMERQNYPQQQQQLESPNMSAVRKGTSFFMTLGRDRQYEKDDLDEGKAGGGEKDDEAPDDDAIMPEANLPPLPLAVITAARNMLNPNALSSARIRVKGLASLTAGPHNSNVMVPMYDCARPFACNQCSKKFRRTDDLNRHLRTHTGEKPFACNECEKRFMRSDHLKKHLNTHIRIR